MKCRGLEYLRAELERQRGPRDGDRPAEPEEPPGQPDVDVDLERRPEGAQDSQVEGDRRLGRLPEEAVREQDVRAPGCLTLPGTGVPPELALLGDQEAVAGVPALALVVEDALEGRREEPLELLPEHRQRPARARGRRDAEGGAEVGEVAAEFDVGALAPHRFRRQVGQDQTRVPAEREPDVRRRQDREREVAVTPDELVGLGVAVRERRLDQRPGQETDLAGGVGVLLVEVERLSNQAAGALGLPGSRLNICRMKL